jgi:hypothetical protein
VQDPSVQDPSAQVSVPKCQCPSVSAQVSVPKCQQPTTLYHNHISRALCGDHAAHHRYFMHKRQFSPALLLARNGVVIPRRPTIMSRSIVFHGAASCEPILFSMCGSLSSD